MSRGEYAEAESVLKTAEQKCIQSLEDDGVPEDEIEDEVSIIR